MSRIAQDLSVSKLTGNLDGSDFNGSLYRAIARAYDADAETGEATLMNIDIPDPQEDKDKPQVVRYRVADLLVLNEGEFGKKKDKYMFLGTGELDEAEKQTIRSDKTILESTVMEMFGVQTALINLREREITGSFINEEGEKRNTYGPASFKAIILMDKPDREIAKALALENYQAIVASRTASIELDAKRVADLA